MFKRILFSDLRDFFLLSLTLFFMLLVFLPVITANANPSSAFLKIHNIFLYGTCIAAALAMPTSVLLALSRRGRNAKAWLLALILAVLTVAIFLPTGTGQLVGNETASDVSAAAMVLQILKYAVPLLGFGLLFRLRPQLQRPLFAASAALMVLFVAYASLTVPIKERGTYSHEKLDKATALGTEKNYFLLFIDEAQGFLFHEALMKYPALQELFPGFTLYPMAISPFPLTVASVPTIYSGHFFDDKLDDLHDINATLGHDSIHTDMINGGLLASKNDYVHHSQVSFHTPYYVNSLQYGQLVTISLSRLLPAGALDEITDLAGTVREWLSGHHFWKEEEVFFCYEFSRRLHMGTQPYGIFDIHLQTAHAPHIYDEDGRLYDPPLRVMRSNVVNESAYIFKLINVITDKIKALKAYDNSMFLIFSDHGSYCTMRPMDFLDAPYMGVRGASNFPVGRYNPLVFCKPFGATHPLAFSNAAASNLDIRKTFATALGLDTTGIEGEDIFSMADRQTRRIPIYISKPNDPSYDLHSKRLSGWRRIDFEGALPDLAETFQTIKVDWD